MERTTTLAGAGASQLKKVLKTRDLVFFSLAANGPLTVVAGALPVAYLVSGNPGVPALLLAVATTLALFTMGFAAMSRHIANAGAFYAYIAAGLGKVPAVAAAFTVLFAYNATIIGVYGLIGPALSGYIAQRTGLEMPWWAASGLIWIVVAIFGVLRINISAKVLGCAMLLEVVIILLFNINGLATAAAGENTFTGFQPSIAFGPGFGIALVFAFLAFSGFEQPAAYAEEVENPRKTVSRAMILNLVLISCFYGLSSWIFGIVAGLETITDAGALIKAGYVTPDGQAPDPTVTFFALSAAKLGPLFVQIAEISYLISLFASVSAFHNVIARYFMVLGREGVLPPAFGYISPRTSAPVIGSLAQSLIALAVVSIFAAADLDPILSLFTWLPAVGAMGFALVLVLASISVLLFFRSRPDIRLSFAIRTIFPAAGAVALTAILLLMAVNFNLLITGDPELPFSVVSLALLALLAFVFVAGLARGLQLKKTAPASFAAIGETSV